MSEAAADERGREIWIEKYRPESLEDIVGQEGITERLQRYIDQQDLPHLMFAGPAGVGKCLTGETPVLTNRGVERIESVVGGRDGFDTPDDDLEVVTFDDTDGFEFVSPSHVFGKETDSMVRLNTRDGNEITVTPEHRLLTIDPDGLSWTRAERLESGDRIARPNAMPLPDGDGTVEWLGALDSDRIFVHVTEEFARDQDIPATEIHAGKAMEVFEGIRAGETDRDVVTPENTVRDDRRQSTEIDLEATVCSLSYLRSLDVSRETLREHVDAIQYVASDNCRSRPIEPPWEVTTELATLLGFAVSTAHIERSRITVYDNDEGLLEQFSQAARETFGVEPKRGVQKGVPYRAIDNRTVVYFLRRCFAVLEDGAPIGSHIVGAPTECRRAFLRAVFDAEAHVTEEGTLELTQNDGDLITLVSYLLAGDGIPTRRTTGRNAAPNGSGENRAYVLSISGASALSRFEDAVGFTVPRKAERLSENAAQSGDPAHDTVPVQDAVDDLCTTLYLPKGVTETLNPKTPGRENYLADIDRTLDAAAEKIEIAQKTLETVQRLETTIDRLGTPATWVGERDRPDPLTARREIDTKTGGRSDRLPGCSEGRRTPERRRETTLLEDAGATTPDLETVQTELRAAIERLGVPYNHLAEGTDLLGTDMIDLLESDDHDPATVTRLHIVAERLRETATEMLSRDVLEELRTLETLSRGDLYFDAVESVERIEGSRRVYDLTVPGTRNYVAGTVPTVMHNTTTATAIAREVYGDDWRENFLELNASDERGIDVVRDRIKSFARASFGGYDHRIIFLDEADALTSDAQSALRRTMEQFADNVRFILSCNYSSQIIDPIQSRCAVFRFSPLGEKAIESQIRRIADAEGISVTDGGIDALVYAAAGDMRKAINGLQAAAVMGETVDEDAVYAITSTARPEEIHEMVTKALEGDFTAARSQLETLLTDAGIAGGDIIDQLHRSVWEFDLDDREAVRVLQRIGEADYRITAGANEQLQLEALLASLALEE